MAPTNCLNAILHFLAQIGWEPQATDHQVVGPGIIGGEQIRECIVTIDFHIHCSFRCSRCLPVGNAHAVCSARPKTSKMLGVFCLHQSVPDFTLAAALLQQLLATLITTQAFFGTLKDAERSAATLVSSDKFSGTSLDIGGDWSSGFRSTEKALRRCAWVGFSFDNLFSFESLPHIRTKGIQVVFM